MRGMRESQLATILLEPDNNFILDSHGLSLWSPVALSVDTYYAYGINVCVKCSRRSRD